MIEPLEGRRLLAVAGQLDPSFGGGDGVVPVAGPTFYGGDRGVFDVMPDGRIVIARSTAAATDATLTVSRYLADGSVDTSFGGTGGASPGSIVPASFDFLRISDLEVDSAGRILIGGSTGSNMAVIRLTPGGTLDVSFGGTAHGMPANTPAGVAVASFGLGDEHLRDMAVAADGRIGVVGVSNPGDDLNQSATAAVFTPDGSLIPALSQVWVRQFTTTIPDNNAFGVGNAVAFTPDGGFVVGGMTGEQGLRTSRTHSWVLIKYRPDGQAEWRWDGPSGLTDERGVDSIAVRPDGSILVGGGAGRAIVLARLGSGGTVDTSFGDGGATITPDPFLASLGPDIIGDAVATAQEIELLPDGRFYVIGDARASAGSIVTLARYTADGWLDPVYPGPFTVDEIDGSILSAPHLDLRGDDPLVLNPQPSNSGVLFLRRFVGRESALRNSKETLQVQGTSGDDTIAITFRHRDNRIVVRVNGDDLVQSFPPRPIRRIQAFGFGGDDLITIAPGVPYIGYVDAGDGNDTVHGGDLDDYLIGGAGHDQLVGNNGNDHLEGNAGNDYLLGSAGKDALYGNGGRDTLSGAGGHDALFGGPGQADRILGGAGADSAADDPLDSYNSIETLLR